MLQDLAPEILGGAIIEVGGAMRIAAVLLSLSLLTPAYSQPAQEAAPYETAPGNLTTELSSATAAGLPPLTVTAPRLSEKQARELKTARSSGAVVAGAGAGLALNAGIIGLGAFIVVWGGALLFVGGLTAYLCHRRLQGKDDFGPGGEDDSAQQGAGALRPAPSARTEVAASPSGS
jgi:hypothetical protein